MFSCRGQIVPKQVGKRFDRRIVSPAVEEDVGAVLALIRAEPSDKIDPVLQVRLREIGADDFQVLLIASAVARASHADLDDDSFPAHTNPFM